MVGNCFKSGLFYWVLILTYCTPSRDVSARDRGRSLKQRTASLNSCAPSQKTDQIKFNCHLVLVGKRERKKERKQKIRKHKTRKHEKGRERKKTLTREKT